MTCIIQQNKMSIAVKLGRVNAILHQHKFNSGNIQISFFLDFAAERIFGTLTRLDLAAGNPPQIRPFLRSDHQNLSSAIKDQGSYVGNWHEVSGSPSWL